MEKGKSCWMGDWSECLLLREAFGCVCRRIPLPPAGPDAPTPAREKGLQPYGALTLFFRWRKKSVQKKASGTATPGKSPLLPIFERGSSQCRAQHSWTANIYVRARSCSLFSSFKKGKAFSLRCLSPLCSPAVGAGQAYPLRVGMLPCCLKNGSIIKVGVITKRKTNDSQTDKVSLTRKHTGGESLVRERVYNRTAEIGRRPD